MDEECAHARARPHARALSVAPGVHSGKLLCLDLEGVLIPECWIALAELTGLEELKRTTAHEPDYDKLMKHRIDALRKHNVKISVRRAKLRGTQGSPQRFVPFFLELECRNPSSARGRHIEIFLAV